MELAKRQVKLYKRVRPYLSGDFYPLTDCTLDRPWLAYQFHRNDLGRGFALIFKRKALANREPPPEAGDTFAFAPRGLDPQARYAISCQASGRKAVYTGAELAKGVTAHPQGNSRGGTGDLPAAAVNAGTHRGVETWATRSLAATRALIRADAGRHVRIPGHRLHSADFLAALELCNQMIPVEERQGTPEETTEQLRNAQERRAQGHCPFEDYHFVAKLASGVCGYMQLFFHPAEKFAFLGFLVVRASLSLGKQMAWVTRMCQEIHAGSWWTRNFGRVTGCFWNWTIQAAPWTRKTAKGREKNRAFEAICQQCGPDLRLLEFDYLQARLGLPADWSGPERPHLLGCRLAKGRKAAWTGQMVCNVLRLIYTRLNPEGVYDGEAEKDDLYRSYLKELCAKECARVPASVRLLTAGEFVARPVGVAFFQRIPGTPCAETRHTACAGTAPAAGHPEA